MSDDQPRCAILSDPQLYADVIVPRHLAGSFTYTVPAQLKPILKIGHCVLVPFGKSQVQGAVISLTQTLPPGLELSRLRQIASIVTDNGSAEISLRALELAKQVADYYVAPWGQCLRLVMPPSAAKLTGKVRVMLSATGREALAEGHKPEAVQSLLKRLSRRPTGIARATLLSRDPVRQAALIDGLVQKGWIIEGRRSPSVPDGAHRVPSGNENGAGRQPVRLSRFPLKDTVPSDWSERVAVAVKSRAGKKLVLQAPWPARYALLTQTIRRTVDEGRTVLVLVGEGDRARWLAEQLSRSGIAVSACLCQGLSDEANALIWQQARRPDPQVVVGTRSAVFLPFTSLGLIWVERAEDHSLKEPQEPRYHAGDVAWLRARSEGAVLILSSPHPLLEPTLSGDESDELLYQELPVRLRPKIEAVDLRPLGRGTVLSPPLLDAMRETVLSNGKVVLFLNRKGYATALVCQDCGQVPRCDSCRVALVYHRHTGSLTCSYCGADTAIPPTCSYCAGHRLRLIGEGTERVEEEVKRLFPEARVLRVDGETTRRPSQAAALWKAVEEGRWDVLAGTQAVLRDYLVPSVDLVGAVLADTSLSLPDYHAAERTYHLLCDAASLARPASEGGRVLIQSYLPSHHAVQAVVQQDGSVFTSEELSQRAALGYPPAVHLIALQVSGTGERPVQEAAEAWVRRLQVLLSLSVAARAVDSQILLTGAPDDHVVLGPVPPSVPKLRGRFRRLILIKSRVRERGIQAVRDSIAELERAYPARVVKFDVDVDPVDMW